MPDKTACPAGDDGVVGAGWAGPASPRTRLRRLNPDSVGTETQEVLDPSTVANPPKAESCPVTPTKRAAVSRLAPRTVRTSPVTRACSLCEWAACLLCTDSLLRRGYLAPLPATLRARHSRRPKGSGEVFVCRNHQVNTFSGEHKTPCGNNFSSEFVDFSPRRVNLILKECAPGAAGPHPFSQAGWWVSLISVGLRSLDAAANKETRIGHGRGNRTIRNHLVHLP